MTTTKIIQRQSPKKIVRKIDFMFYHEAEIKAALDSLSPATSIIIEGVEIERPVEWLKVINQTYAHFERSKPHYAEAARQRYSGQYYQQGAAASGLKHSQFFNAINTFKQMALIYAIQARLFSDDEISTY